MEDKFRKIQQFLRYDLGVCRPSVLCSFQACVQFLKTFNFLCDINLVQLEDQITELPDQISGLPDDVLSLVLSQLSLEEAARSCALSHRWRHLYWEFTKNLNFDEGSGNLQSRSKRCSFVKRVNEILESKENCVLEQLRIRFSLEKRFKHDVENWVEFAFSKRVKKFDLDLLVPSRTNSDFLDATNCDCFDLHHEIFSRIEGTTCFRSLEELRLRDVAINEETVNFLLNKFPNLERLSIVDSPSLVSFKVTGGPNSVLKYLELTGRFESVEISDVSNLVCLSLHRNHYWERDKIVFGIENAPSLVDLRIGGGFANLYFMGVFNDLFTNLSCSLKSLTVMITSDVCYEYIRFMPTMTAVERLVVQTTVSDCTTGLSAYLTRLFPSLRDFLFQAAWQDSMDIPKKKYIWDRRDIQCNVYLKEVKIYGYYGCSRDVQIALYFFHCCIGLERIIIDPHDQSNVLFGLSPNDCDTDREQAARSRAEEQLQGVVPAGVEFVIL